MLHWLKKLHTMQGTRAAAHIKVISEKSDLEIHFDDMVNDQSVKDIISYQTFVSYAKGNGYTWFNEDRGAVLAILRNKALKCNGGVRIKTAGTATTLYAIRNAGKWGGADTGILRREYDTPWGK